jgi:hypothetical protein
VIDVFDFETILLRAKTDAQAHFPMTFADGALCCCGQYVPCPAKHLLEETVPALVYALEEGERVHAGEV